MNTIISRQDAIATNIRRYFTVNPCCRGHISERYVVSGMCVSCSSAFGKSEEYKAKRRDKSKTEANKQKSREKSAKFHKENRERILEEMRIRNKAYYEKNKKKIIDQVRTYALANREWRMSYASNWIRDKRENDPVFAMQCTMRKFVSRVMDRINKKRKENERTKDIVGYTAQEFVAHIEPMFKAGMSWENYGKWHIDHIRPLSSFDLLDEEQRKLANSLHNLQPLWASKNLKKSDKWDGQATLI